MARALIFSTILGVQICQGLHPAIQMEESRKHVADSEGSMPS